MLFSEILFFVLNLWMLYKRYEKRIEIVKRVFWAIMYNYIGNNYDNRNIKAEINNSNISSIENTLWE